MAYSALSDSQIDGDSPLVADTLFKLRDNPEAIAAGDPGAPRVVTDALDNAAVTTAKLADAAVTSVKLGAGTNERDWVLARTAAASVGAVGTYAMLTIDPPANLEPGATVAGSSLNYNNATGSLDISSPSGTWRLMGDTESGSEQLSTSLFLRIS